MTRAPADTAEHVPNAALASPPSAGLPAATSNFYLAMRILPRAQRDAMYAVYAFCQMVEEAIAPPASPPAAPATLGPSCNSAGSVEQTVALFRERLEKRCDS